MAQAKTLPGSSLFIMVGDGATPEVFAHPCLINGARSLQLSAETADTNVPDCDDPEAIAWIEREKRSLSAQITGEGTLNTTDTESYFNWLKSEDTKNIRVKLNGITGANGGGYFSGAFHLTAFEVSGNRGEKANCSLTMLSSGAIAWTDNA